MIGTNHYLFGVATATVVGNPVFALPLAFASHFVLDILPHFGVKIGAKNRGKIIIIDAIIDFCLLITMIVLTLQQYPAWYVLAGLVAMSPDFAWIYRFVFKERFGALPPPARSKFNAWHAGIQKLESIPGVLVEIVFCATFAFLLFV